MESDLQDGLDHVDDPQWDDVREWDESDADADAVPDWQEPCLDAVDRVVVSGAIMSVHAAEQLRSIDDARREALAEAARAGNHLADVIERSVRLELAAALGMTEAAVGPGRSHSPQRSRSEHFDASFASSSKPFAP